MVMLMETPASTFYLNLNAENNNTYKKYIPKEYIAECIKSLTVFNKYICLESHSHEKVYSTENK